MSTTVRSKRVVWSCSVTFLSFAMPVSMLGVMWPDVRERFGQSLGTLGVVSLVYGLSRMSTSGSGRLATRRFGIGFLLFISHPYRGLFAFQRAAEVLSSFFYYF